MSINASRNDEFVGAIYNFGFLVSQVFRECCDLSVLKENISLEGEIRVHNSSIFEEIGLIIPIRCVGK
jgi:hypothetical protein